MVAYIGNGKIYIPPPPPPRGKTAGDTAGVPNREQTQNTRPDAGFEEPVSQTRGEPGTSGKSVLSDAEIAEYQQIIALAESRLPPDDADQSPYPRQKLYAAEAPALYRREREAVDLLVPGFLDAGLTAALDDSSLTKALDAHARAIIPLSDEQAGFRVFVDRAKSDARRKIDDIFDREIEFTDASTGGKKTANLRQLMAEAEGTTPSSRRQDASPEWRNVRAGMVALMDKLAQESANSGGGNADSKGPIKTQTIRNVAGILAAATPNSDLAPENDPYLSTVNAAAEEVLILRPLAELDDVANDEQAAIDAGDPVLVLTKLAEQTKGIPPELAAMRIAASDSHVRDTVLNLFYQSLELETGALIYNDGTVSEAMASLSTMADRVYGGQGGEEAIRDLANAVVTVLDRSGEQSRSSSQSLAGQIGTGLQEAIGEGSSTVLAEEIARQLMDREVVGKGGLYDTEASIILRQAAAGVDKLNKNAESAGTEFYDKIVLPSELGRRNLQQSSTFSHEAGVNALLKENGPLVERSNRYAEGIVILTLTSESRGLSPELQGLDGARRLQDARNDLKSKAALDVATGEGKNTEIHPIPLLLKSSPSATLIIQRVANAQALEEMQKVPAEDLDRLIEKATALPEDDPYHALATQIASLDDPRAVLYESPELTLTLLNRFSEIDKTRPEEPGDAPSAGFMSRAAKDAINEVFRFQTLSGGGLIPGIQPIQATQEMGDYAKVADRDRNIANAIRSQLHSLPENRFSTLAHSARRQIARGLFGDKPIEARNGIAAAPRLPSSAFYLGAGALNVWAFSELTSSERPMMDKAWGYYFGSGAVIDAMMMGGSLASKSSAPNFSKISGFRAWEWLPRTYNGVGAALALLQVGHEIRQGDLAGAATWSPVAASSIYSLLPGAPAGGPVFAGGLLATATLVTALSQYRRVQESNRLEGPIGTYLEAAAPDVDKPESLANSDENGSPYLALNPNIAEAQGVTPEAMVEWLYRLDNGERDIFIDHALQVKPKHGEYQMTNVPGSDPRPAPEIGSYYNTSTRYYVSGNGLSYGPGGDHIIDNRLHRDDIDTIEDLLLWAKQHGYTLPTA